MISGIGLYLKLCLDYNRYHTTQLNVKINRVYSEYWKNIKSYFISSSLLSGINFDFFKRECKENCPRKFLVGGNWQMNGNTQNIERIMGCLKKAKIAKDVDVIVAVPNIYLEHAKKFACKKVMIAAQNCYKGCTGAFTGEISASMLHDLGIEWVILGDSSRRCTFGENDELIGDKIEDALCGGIRVIACVVDGVEDHKNGKSKEVIFRQLNAIEYAVQDWCEIVVAYEPVWSFEEEMTVKQVQQMHCQIRTWIRENNSEELAKNVRIIYAGKVDCKNAKELAAQRDIDGFLIGESSYFGGFLRFVNIEKVKDKQEGPCQK